MTVPRVLCCGDSLTAGMVPGEPSAPYSKTLAKTLGVPVDEIGICGTRADAMLENLEGDRGILTHLRLKEYTVAVIMVGTNDLSYAHPAEQILSDVQKLHALCHRRGVRTIALPIPPSTYATGNAVQRISAHWSVFNKALEEWAATLHDKVLFVNTNVAIPFSMSSGDWASDGLHMTPQGYAALGRYLGQQASKYVLEAPRPSPPQPPSPAPTPSFPPPIVVPTPSLPPFVVPTRLARPSMGPVQAATPLVTSPPAKASPSTTTYSLVQTPLAARPRFLRSSSAPPPPVVVFPSSSPHEAPLPSVTPPPAMPPAPSVPSPRSAPARTHATPPPFAVTAASVISPPSMHSPPLEPFRQYVVPTPPLSVSRPATASPPQVIIFPPQPPRRSMGPRPSMSMPLSVAPPSPPLSFIASSPSPPTPPSAPAASVRLVRLVPAPPMAPPPPPAPAVSAPQPVTPPPSPPSSVLQPPLRPLSQKSLFVVLPPVTLPPPVQSPAAQALPVLSTLAPAIRKPTTSESPEAELAAGTAVTFLQPSGSTVKAVVVGPAEGDRVMVRYTIGTSTLVTTSASLRYLDPIPNFFDMAHGG